MYQKEISEKILKSTGNVTVVVDGWSGRLAAAPILGRPPQVVITDDGRRWL